MPKQKEGLGMCGWKSGIVYIERVRVEGANLGHMTMHHSSVQTRLNLLSTFGFASPSDLLSDQPLKGQESYVERKTLDWREQKDF